MPENVERSLSVPSHVQHVEDDLRHVIVMNTRSGEIFALDRSAAVIWNALATSGSVVAAMDALVSRYEVTPQRAASDVHEFVERLVQAQLLTRQ